MDIKDIMESVLKELQTRLLEAKAEVDALRLNCRQLRLQRRLDLSRWAEVGWLLDQRRRDVDRKVSALRVMTTQVCLVEAALHLLESTECLVLDGLGRYSLPFASQMAAKNNLRLLGLMDQHYVAWTPLAQGAVVLLNEFALREAQKSCVFCKIAAGTIPSQAVYEGDKVLAFRSIQPDAPTHIILIPRLHVASLAHVTPHNSLLLGQLLLTASQVAARLGLAEGGYRVMINTGAFAGQTVHHLHVHLLGGPEGSSHV